MLDLNRLRRTRVLRRPRFQRFVAYVLLAPNYHAFPGVKIELEGLSNLPDEPVIFAMNHTDRYNYWPLQYQLWRETDRFTATWVKGKNYEHPMSALFLGMTNNIPIPSRGYLITRDFLSVTGRRPTDEEYSVLRGLVDKPEPTADIEGVPRDVFDRQRDMMGRPFDPTHEDYGSAMQGLLAEMMEVFVDCNEQAFDVGVDLLVFPQGTRSIRLSKGRPGLAQMALHCKRPIVPVGCNGSDLAYTGGSPVAGKGHIVYRIGEPITVEELAKYDPGPFTPFDPADERRHRAKFQALVDDVMDRVNGLLDERHKYGDGMESDGVSGTARFV